MFEKLTKQEEGVDITANAVHPGTILTNLTRYDNLSHCKLRLLYFISIIWLGEFPTVMILINFYIIYHLLYSMIIGVFVIDDLSETFCVFLDTDAMKVLLVFFAKSIPQVLFYSTVYKWRIVYTEPLLCMWVCSSLCLILNMAVQGAATTCFVALNPQVKGVSGEYFVDCNVAKSSSQAKDADLATKLWDFSMTLTKVK